MKRLIGLSLAVMLVLTTGCAFTAGSNAGPAHSGFYTKAHDWKTPGFTADLESNPVSSELTLGYISMGSHLGWSAQDKWVALTVDCGPEAPADDGDGGT